MIDVPSEVISCNLQQLLGIWRNRDIFLRSPNILSRTAEHFSRADEHFSVAFDVISTVPVNPQLNDFGGGAFCQRPLRPFFGRLEYFSKLWRNNILHLLLTFSKWRMLVFHGSGNTSIHIHH